jgi:membrane protease subunit HflK
MPWNNQSGGPWGAGGKNPTPPNLEELLRRVQDKLRTVLPGGNLGSKGIGLVAIAELGGGLRQPPLATAWCWGDPSISV